jgi:hypothetical protein
MSKKQTVSAPRKHPIAELLVIAEESARIMWRSYDAHLGLARLDPEWEKKTWAIYQRCMACEDHIWRIKEMRERAFGPKQDGAATVAQ